MEKVKIFEKFDKLDTYWSPGIIAALNNYHVKLVKVKGEFVWHEHEETDEMFFVIEGSLKILLRDREITLEKGEMFIVPKGTEHKPVAETECRVMLIEPEGVVNTGEAGGELTADKNRWI